MRALTEIAPWGFAIMQLGKNVENRQWSPPDSMIGTRFAIHQGKKLDMGSLEELQDDYPQQQGLLDSDLVLGAVLGTVLLRGYVNMQRNAHGLGLHPSPGLSSADKAEAFDSKWAQNGSNRVCWWLLGEPRLLRTPIYCRGMQGLWTVPEDVLEQMHAQGVL